MTRPSSFCLSAALVLVALAAIASAADIELFSDEKAFKTLLKTRPNLLVLFSKSDAEAKDALRVLKDAGKDIKGVAAIAYTNCETNKKLCKKLKVSPNPTELKHYNEGTFNKDYDRPLVKKSVISFLKDPTGDLPWDEEETAKDVVHLKDEASFNKLLKKTKVGILAMFYAPWCGFCKKLKPDYSLAATEVKPKGILAAINCDLPENYALKRTYNITGFPTLLYFKDGKMEMQYGGEMNKDSLVEWMDDPQPPTEKEEEKSWADEEDVHVTFLADDTFDAFIETHSAVLVMFYAPWCGHCKNMKPTLNKVAKTLKDEGSSTIIAFVDATKHQALGTRFKVKGYPTVKFFKDGEFAWDYNERDEAKILEYLRNPQEPPPAPAPKEAEPEWKDEPSLVVHAESANFASLIKTKRHALVMFYAPWCGHCKNAKPHFRDAAEHFKEDIKVTFVAVDCTKEKEVCEQYDVKGFPTILYFNFGKNPKPYEGGREKKDFVKFMSNPADPNAAKADQRDEWIGVEGHEHINFLDDATFDEFVAAKSKVLVLVYAPWCGHCKALKPAYGQAARQMKSFLPGAYLAAVDGTKSPALNARFAVKGYPTLKYYENGQFKFDYDSGRTADEIVAFMREPKQRSPPPPPQQAAPTPAPAKKEL